MTKTKHRYVHAGGELVARVSAGYAPDRRLKKDLEANARLIAASPRMYDFIAERADAGDIEAAAILGGIHAEN